MILLLYLTYSSKIPETPGTGDRFSEFSAVYHITLETEYV
jgi:hypothetical protein